jgi:parallel beta-helix repeat protein
MHTSLCAMPEGTPLAEYGSSCGHTQQGRLQIMNIRVHVQGVVCLICGLALLSSLVHAQRSEAKTYYVDTNGDDRNPGDTENQPFQTIRTGARALQPGDTLLVKNGTYTGTLAFYGPPNDPSGTSDKEPVTIAAYRGARPVIRPNPGDHALYISYTSYMIIEGFFIDGTNGNAGVKITDGASHITIRDTEIANAFDGIEVNDGAEENELEGLRIYGSTYYGIYIASSKNTVTNCSIHDNMGYGIHVYNGAGGVDGNIISGNTISNNGQSRGQSGIIISHGARNQVDGNTISGNVGGLFVDYGASGTNIKGNTISRNTWTGIYIGPGSSGTLIDRDNDISCDRCPPIINNGVSTQILQ